MSDKRTRDSKCLPTSITHVRLLSSMPTNMIGQCAGLGKSLSTPITDIWLLSTMLPIRKYTQSYKLINKTIWRSIYIASISHTTFIQYFISFHLNRPSIYIQNPQFQCFVIKHQFWDQFKKYCHHLYMVLKYAPNIAGNYFCLSIHSLLKSFLSSKL